MPNVFTPAHRRRHRRWPRLVLAILLLLVVALAAGAVVGYGFLRRGLPQLQGELAVAGLQQPVTVYRDAYGVPHIYATNRHDLFFAQGFVTAQDRLWQMDLSRRAAAGRLSEVFGDRSLENDKFLRSFAMHRSAEKSLQALSPQALEVLQQFSDGVNAYIKQAAATGRLPPEMRILGYTPEPWAPVHTVGIAKFMAYDLGGNWRAEVWNFQLAQKVGADRARELLPHYPDGAPVIMEYAAGLDLDRLIEVAWEEDQWKGSNNWVVAGSRTASGKPMLANDPHLGLGAPSIWYQTHLAVPGELNVIGVTFPGAPGIIIGHNDDIAWGVTNLGPDVQDLYLEIPNPANPLEFLYDGRWEPATVWVEEIRVKGQDQPVRFEIPVTRHGPVVTPVIGSRDNRPAAALALRWTAHEATAEMDAFLRLNQARNWDEFRNALRYFAAPMQNFVFAAADGDIGYRGNGWVPIRRRGDGKFPAPGWDPAYEWQGYVPWEELPELHNPPAGFIATANARVVNDSYPYFLTDDWAPPYRTIRIREVLEQASGWTVADMQSLQVDFANLQARQLLPALQAAAVRGLAAMGGAEPLEAQALQVLSDWDQADTADSAGAAIWHAWYRHLQREVYEDEMGHDLFGRMQADIAVTDRLIVEASAGNPSPWIDNVNTPEQESFELVAAASLRAAVAELRSALGRNPAKWRWGELHRVPLQHSMGGVPVLGSIFNVKPSPMGGSRITVGAAPYPRIGPGYDTTAAAPWRQVVDMADLAGNSWDVTTPGQSGHPLSRHYDDQAPLWLRGDYHPQLFSESQLQEARRLVLQPGGR